MTDEEYVRSKWEGVHVGEITGMIRVGERDNIRNEAGRSWCAAAEFTRQREEKIRQVEEEIAYLHNIMGEAVNKAPTHCIHRILACEQAALAELKRGMK